MEKQILVDLISQGFSQRRIAKDLSVGQSTVRYWLRKYGLHTNHYRYGGKTASLHYCVNCSKVLSRTQCKFCCRDCESIYKWRQKKIEIETTDTVPFTKKYYLITPAGKRYLIETYGHKCQICGRSIWNGLPIPLIADHIDGDATNNSIENLRLICPNCDAQTSTYKGKNKGNGRKAR